MRNRALFLIAILPLVLAGCDWITGHNRSDDQDEPGANVSASAEGKAEAGQVTLKAPGLDVTFTVPKALTKDVKVHNDIDILYPKTSITGMYAAGGQDDGSEVEFRFTSPDTPETVAAWYREPARAAAFKLDGISDEAGATVIRGAAKDDGKGFKISLSAHPGGGTDGRLIVRSKG